MCGKISSLCDIFHEIFFLKISQKIIKMEHLLIKNEYEIKEQLITIKKNFVMLFKRNLKRNKKNYTQWKYKITSSHPQNGILPKLSWSLE